MTLCSLIARYDTLRSWNVDENVALQVPLVAAQSDHCRERVRGLLASFFKRDDIRDPSGWFWRGLREIEAEA